jgi:hypothetical protein
MDVGPERPTGRRAIDLSGRKTRIRTSIMKGKLQSLPR